VLPSRSLARAPGAALALALAAAPLVLLSPRAAHATTFLETSVEELARGADVVVRGRVVRTSARFHGGRIVTEAEIGVASAWKGTPGERITVRVPGGRAGGVAQQVAGSPSFLRDEEVVVFAARSGPDALGVVGLALGKFRVEEGVARPALEGARVEARRLAAGERAPAEMSVEELERRVRAAR
jgi:hypothetical protein